MKNNYQKLEWTPENIKNFWEYESQFESRYFTFNVAEELLDIVSSYIHKGESVLDYGSGRGHLVKYLLKRGFKVSAVDYSQKSIEHIKREYSGHKNFIKAFSTEDLGEIKTKFDIIFLLETIEHLNDEELKKTINILKMSLSDKGKIIISTPNSENLRDNTICCPECKKIFHRWQHVRSWTKSSLENYLLLNNFTILKCFVTDLNQEKIKKKLNFFQKVGRYIYEGNREWVYKPHLICVVQK